MVKEIIGFLSEKGWAGVENVYFLVGFGVLVGMMIVYYLLAYHKMEMPRRITVKSHIIKIILSLALLVFILVI